MWFVVKPVTLGGSICCHHGSSKMVWWWYRWFQIFSLFKFYTIYNISRENKNRNIGHKFLIEWLIYIYKKMKKKSQKKITYFFELLTTPVSFLDEDENWTVAWFWILLFAVCLVKLLVILVMKSCGQQHTMIIGVEWACSQ